MIDAALLLSDLQGQQKKLEADLRERIATVTEIKDSLESEYKAAREAKRTGDTFATWCEGEIAQAAVAWLLGCVFLRFCEDNKLITTPLLAGPGHANRRAKESAREYFQAHPTDNDRHYLQHAFKHLAQFPAVAGLFEPAHNPLFRLPISVDAAAALVEFWQKVNPDTGELVRNFTDPELDTRFLGDLYQDLSDFARKRYALLQTPLFVEEFILDRTLDPAIDTFGLEHVRMIDPTCGSGHFLLGGFARINARLEKRGIEPRERVKRSLAAVYGVDLNPFAVAIAQFRLLMAALKATGIGTLKEAPGWKFNVTAGDSLLHGTRFGELDFGSDNLSNRYSHFFAAEDRDEIDRILGQQYHAVVGNPPYIAVRDTGLNELYRLRYESCYRQYSLGVPFTERFIQLALTENKPSAGYIGLITTNSFMKREFGKKLIEQYLPKQDLTHVIDTSGAYIPGHGTPTVILFARHRKPVADTVRMVLGVCGEPGTPDEPALGAVWTSIKTLIDKPGSESEFISVTDTLRASLSLHPWSLSGGGAPALLDAIGGRERRLLETIASEIGRTTHTGEDNVFYVPPSLARRQFASRQYVELVSGEDVRDWYLAPRLKALFPYGRKNGEVLESLTQDLSIHFWTYRSNLRKRRDFGNYVEERGLKWFEHSMFFPSRYRIALSIAFAFVATHNHFVLDRGGSVFNRTAPVIKLLLSSDRDTYIGLLGLLNSSTACFWMKQVFFNKGEGGGTRVDAGNSALGNEEWKNHYEFTGTGLYKFPLAETRPLHLATRIDQFAEIRAMVLPSALVTRFPLSRIQVAQARDQAKSLLAQMIGTQEELDWWCYRAYALLEDDLCYSGKLPELSLGERAFEIVMARQIVAGELETTWFERHGSSPITDLPNHWPSDYAKLVERRIALIDSHPWIGLLEKPEYKRRWNQPSWEELEKAALESWLLDRLEASTYWPEYVLQSMDALNARAEGDADFMAVAALYADQEGFALRPLLSKLLAEESVPALRVLRYKDSGLRKRVDWEHTWELQRREDAIDAEVEREMPRQPDETNTEWEARLKPEQTRRKREQVGDISAPPKYATPDFLTPTIKRLRGELDVPKERFFTLPKGDEPGELLYGWAGWNHVQRVQAIAGAYTDAESRQGWPVEQLVPLLAAVNEELPWLLQWHNQVDADLGLRLGDYFRTWLGSELQKHSLTLEDLDRWQPVRGPRATRVRRKTA